MPSTAEICPPKIWGFTEYQMDVKVVHAKVSHPLTQPVLLLVFFFLGKRVVFIRTESFIYVNYPLKASLSQAVQNLKQIKLPRQTSSSISLSIHAVTEYLITFKTPFFSLRLQSYLVCTMKLLRV